MTTRWHLRVDTRARKHSQSYLNIVAQSGWRRRHGRRSPGCHLTAATQAEGEASAGSPKWHTHFHALRPTRVENEINKGERRGGGVPEALRLSHGCAGTVEASLTIPGTSQGRRQGHGWSSH